jgi:putative pyruvate formate lyase activating enzyme
MSRCTANAPHIWNSNMYMSTEALKLLDGVIDVYLADFKYGNDECAKRLSDAPDYMQVATRNHLIARSHAEMVIRHLVLPGHLDCCTRPVLEWIAGNLEGVVVNVMAQYRPEHRAMEFAELSRPLRADEHRKAMTIADDLGLTICV